MYYLPVRVKETLLAFSWCFASMFVPLDLKDMITGSFAQLVLRAVEVWHLLASVTKLIMIMVYWTHLLLA